MKNFSLSWGFNSVPSADQVDVLSAKLPWRWMKVILHIQGRIKKYMDWVRFSVPYVTLQWEFSEHVWTCFGVINQWHLTTAIQSDAITASKCSDCVVCHMHNVWEYGTMWCIEVCQTPHATGASSPFSKDVVPCVFFLPRVTTLWKINDLIKLDMAQQLLEIPRTEYGRFIQQWKSHWNMCTQLERGYVEGDWSVIMVRLVMLGSQHQSGYCFIRPCVMCTSSVSELLVTQS